MNLHTAKHVHFIGIGGIGVSAIAKWSIERGLVVSGSDLTESPSAMWLRQHGAQVRIGPHQASAIPELCDLVVCSVAIRANNPERLEAEKRRIPVLPYPEALAQLFERHVGIAVAGSHGKSTTTALLGSILTAAQRDPTVIVGTRVRDFGDTNERIGKGQEVLVEADEYNQAILFVQPEHAVVLNVDHEHVDVYPTLEKLQSAFGRFVASVPSTGSVTLWAQDPSVELLRKRAQGTVKTFGFQDADLVAGEVIASAAGTSFTVRGLYRGTVQTKLFGEHNVRNILAAMCVSHSLGIPFDTIVQAVQEFPGTWRRFENRGTWQGATIIDDYAHHPTELRATLAAARQAFPGKRIVCVFQPHLHSRTKAFLKNFVKELAVADRVIVVEVYDVVGREDGERVSSQEIVTALGEQASYAAKVFDAVEILQAEVSSSDVVLTVGAGDITHFTEIARHENPPQ